MTITIDQQGRRFYLRGNTFPIKDRLRTAGCKWDADAKCWYTGKRELAEQLAGQPEQSAPQVEEASAQTDPKGPGDRFAGVDVVAAVAGDAARVHRPGVLALAAEASQHGPVVLCLDEVDKAPERVEGLLLDVLQTGRVPIRPGTHLEARLDRLVVCLTPAGWYQGVNDAGRAAFALREMARGRA